MNISGINRDPKEQIMDLSQAKIWRAELKKKNLKLVVTNGCFDILHRGHAEYLMQARTMGDAMLILINSDRSVRELKGPTRPLIDEYNRAYMLCSLESVDSVVMFDTQRCDDIFIELCPDIYVKGGDYTLETINPQEREALQSVNADIRFLPFVDGFSTTDLVNKIKTT
jgi:D-glycero-beta-D-manno-heptose 1-phosphate adenylyltransferase